MDGAAIVDITHLLTSSYLDASWDQVVTFNNSLTRDGGTGYLMVYRFIKPGIPSTKSYEEVNINHPWDIWSEHYPGLLKAITGNNNVNLEHPSYDGTGIALVTIDSNRNVKVTRDKKDLFGEVANSRLDTRVFPDSNGNLLLTYNMYFNGKPKSSYGNCRTASSAVNPDASQAVKNSSYYTTLMYNTLSKSSTGDLPTVNNATEQHLCPAWAEKMEKNWAIVLDSSGVNWVHWGFRNGISYFYRLDSCLADVVNSDGSCSVLSQEHSVPGIQAIADLYKGDCLISLSTPPVDIGGNQLLFVGHIKIKFRNILAQSDYKTAYPRMASFFSDMFGDVDLLSRRYPFFMHGAYIYLMYFYTIDNRSMELTAMSDAFIPSTTLPNDKNSAQPYSLVFPTGLCLSYQNEVIVSYGEGDARTKLLFVPISTVKSMLKSMPTSATDATTFAASYGFDYLRLAQTADPTDVLQYDTPSNPVYPPQSVQDLQSQKKLFLILVILLSIAIGCTIISASVATTNMCLLTGAIGASLKIAVLIYVIIMYKKNVLLQTSPVRKVTIPLISAATVGNILLLSLAAYSIHAARSKLRYGTSVGCAGLSVCICIVCIVLLGLRIRIV